MISSLVMYRKYESGHKKRKKKRRLEAAAQSQKGALDRFVVKESRFSSENQTPDADPYEGRGDDANTIVQAEAQNAEIVQGDHANIAVADEVHGDTDVVDPSLDRSPSIEGNSSKGINNDSQPDIFDPRTWDALDSKMVDILVQKGPKRDLYIEKGPKDIFSRRFSASSYTRVLSNGEKCDREWLVYSKELDKVFCFCCKLLRKGHGKGQLANEGFSNWRHLGTRLKEHETSAEHVTNMATWCKLRLMVQKNQTIAKVVQDDQANIAVADEVSGHADVLNPSLDMSPTIEDNSGKGINNDLQPDIFDPRTWDALDSKMIDILVQKGPKRDLSIEKGPKDKFSRRFCASSYTRVLSNGEKCDREWLVYSKELDRVFCFCCKLWRKGHGKNHLANEGFSNWRHLGTRLREHEASAEHVMNMATWCELRLRLQKNQTIDKVVQRELQKENYPIK